MNKSSVFTLLLLCAGLFSAAQKKKPNSVPPPKPDSLILATLNDSASYAIGVSVASFYREQGIANINTKILCAAVEDVMAKKTPRVDEFTSNAVMNKVMQSAQEEKIKPNLDSGVAFLARNKTRPEVKETASGLQYEVMKEGTGAKPTVSDVVVAHYKGTLVNGTEFESSYSRGEPLEIPLERVIKGWTEGLQLMPIGSKYKFFIPYNLAYGTFDNNSIPGGSTLIFEIELLDIKKTPAN